MTAYRTLAVDGVTAAADAPWTGASFAARPFLLAFATRRLLT